MVRILISGGSGMVGRQLTQLLQQQGYEVAWLSRKPQSKIKTFVWDVEKQTLDAEAIAWADHIVHLAGVSVAEGRWTSKRKKEILESRTHSAALLFDACKQSKKKPTSIISASAMGIYGSNTGDELIEETDDQGTDFLAKVTQAWEDSVVKFTELGMREVRLRISIVLSKQGGALPTMVKPIKMGIGSPLGSGKQFMSWIHIDDLCRMFQYAIENTSIHGAYNASTAELPTNEEFMQALAKTLEKPFFFPAVPSLALRLLLGEKSVIALGGNRLSNQKIIESGFTFTHPQLSLALENLLK